MKTLKQRYIIALTKRYEAQMEEALANLALYLSSDNLAAIGEHSDLLEEHDKWVEKYITAKEKLEATKEIQDLLQ